MGQTNTVPLANPVQLDNLEFITPSESVVVSYGIDVQEFESFREKSLGPIAKSDAEGIANAFIEAGAVEKKNAHIFSASLNRDSCTAEGIKETFQKYASEVGSNGLFAFHFTGHGVTNGRDLWGLAPVEYACSVSTTITAEELLLAWLNELDDEHKCKAKYILITLDCCYAGGVGKAIEDMKHDNKMIVLAACTADEKSSQLEVLGSSTFVYFLSKFITELRTNPGILPMKEIFSECQICCENLSSLYMSYTSESGLKTSTIHPEVISTIMSDGDEEDDTIEFIAEKLYDRTRKINRLHKESLGYLKAFRKGPLRELEKRGFLRDYSNKVMRTAVCSIMHSIASIEMSCGSNVQDFNLCITAFKHIVLAIKEVSPDTQTNNCTRMLVTFAYAWSWYRHALFNNKVNIPTKSKFDGKIMSELYAMKASAEKAVRRIASDGSDDEDEAKDEDEDKDVDEVKAILVSVIVIIIASDASERSTTSDSLYGHVNLVIVKSHLANSHNAYYGPFYELTK